MTCDPCHFTNVSAFVMTVMEAGLDCVSWETNPQTDSLEVHIGNRQVQESQVEAKYQGRKRQ